MANTIIHTIVSGVPSEKRANNAEDIIPLPYCKEPKSAAAEPTISLLTASKAAALEQAATIPFMLKIRKTGTIIPKIPPAPIKPPASKSPAPRAAISVEKIRRLSKEYLLTNFLFTALIIVIPTMLIPKRKP